MDIENKMDFINSVRSKIKCISCGGEIEKDDKFCAICGAFVNNQDILRCSCGQPFQMEDSFCEVCGKAVRIIENEDLTMQMNQPLSGIEIEVYDTIEDGDAVVVENEVFAAVENEIDHTIEIDTGSVVEIEADVIPDIDDNLVITDFVAASENELSSESDPVYVYTEPPMVFASGLPQWSVEPPAVVVRRKLQV